MDSWECQEIEFKKKATSNSEIAEAIAGFATSNNGRIYIGIDQNRRINGLDNLSDGIQKDKYMREIVNISRNKVKPAIRVKVTFIGIGSKTVVRIDVPKGEEPVYYQDFRAYTRDQSITRKLEPHEIEQLYRLYTRNFSNQQNDETINKNMQSALNLIAQLSDTQLFYSDYADHLEQSDWNQLKYDVMGTSEKILSLVNSGYAKKLGIERVLLNLRNSLEDVQLIDLNMGQECADELGSKLQKSAMLSQKIFEQIKKDPPVMSEVAFSHITLEAISSFKDEWMISQNYLKRSEFAKVQHFLRRFGYIFYKFGYAADMWHFLNFENLRDLGSQIRNLSSYEKYFFHINYGEKLDIVECKINEIIIKLDGISAHIKQKS